MSEYDDGYASGLDSGTENEREAVIVFLRAKNLIAEAGAIEGGLHIPQPAGPGTSYSVAVGLWRDMFAAPPSA
jgi:hypothetical protein